MANVSKTKAKFNKRHFRCNVKKSCDVTDVDKAFRKSTNTGHDGALMPIKILAINRASFGVFTEFFDDVFDVK